jgi:polysaccharide export outer membrane protein
MSIRAITAFVCGLCLAMVAASSATAQPAPTESTTPLGGPAPEGASSDYILGRDDVIQVGLLGGVGGFGGRVRVQADGTVQLNFIGKIEAANHTTAELADAIRDALKKGGYFADPVVTIEVVGYASRYVTVLGAVGSPGLIPINRPYRMSDIMARVGGVREGAADYLVVRHEDGTETRLMVRDLATGDVAKDPLVQPGDKVYAPVAEQFYIYGQVNSPGVYPITSGLTLRMAMVRAGGLTQSGSEKKITIMRGGKKVPKVDLDDPVQPGDVIEFGERLF